MGALGVGTVGGGGVLVTRDSDFSRGLGWSLLGIGAIDVIGAVFYTFQVEAQIDRYSRAIRRMSSASRTTSEN